MEITLTFNRPPQQDKVQVTIGNATADDEACRFRVGLIKPDAPGAVHWSLLDWIAGDDVARQAELEIDADRGDVVRIEKKGASGEVSYFDVDTADNWPAAAVGNAPVATSWGFED